MTSYETKAFVAEGDFGSATQGHPALLFGEEVDTNATKVFDSKDHSTIKEWITDDFSVLQGNGTRTKGSAQENFENAKQMYDKLLTSHRHIPVSTIAVDTDTGHKVMSHGFMCGNLLAVSALNPGKVTGPDGSKWDVAVPIFAEFDLVKDANAKHHGLLVKQVRFTIDQNEILKGVEARGISVPSFLKG